MTRRSPISVTYDDLLVLSQRIERGCKARYEGAQGRGTTNLNALRHDLECAKKLVRILKKCEKGKQADFYELFENTK